MTDTGQESWARVKGRLRAELGEDIYTSWFARVDLEGLDEDTVRMSVPTRFLKSWIQSHYTDLVLACWQSEQPKTCRLELVVRSGVLRPLPSTPKPEEASAPQHNGHSGTTHDPKLCFRGEGVSAIHAPLGGSPLDPRLTFETFITGSSNILAHAAAMQVATAQHTDTVLFNPLYIHAGVGMGKTHLLQSITWAGNAAAGLPDGRAGRRVLYLTAEKFMYGFASAIKTQTTLAFKEGLRGIDVLVIDDLQLLQGRSSQAEFCHTLNALIDAGRQVVIAADRPPLDLETLDDRVCSRLEGGIVVEIGSLGEDLRLEILKARVASARRGCAGFDVPAPVLTYIAKTITHDGRSLEGVVNRLLARHKLTGNFVTIEMAQREVRDLVRVQESKRVKIEDIQRVVARQYNISRADLLSHQRFASMVRPRQVAMYLAKTLTLRSLPEIGRRFGGRDHTTVLHAVRKIEGLLDSGTGIAEELERLKRQLQN